MASGTITGKTNNDGIGVKIVWSSVADVEANKSTVTATLYYKRLNNYTTYGTGNFSLAIGDYEEMVNEYVQIRYGVWEVVLSITTTIFHDSNGSKSVPISAEGGIPGTTLNTTDCRATVALDTIPRASTLSSVSNRTLGDACKVKWYPKSESCMYKLQF